MSSAFPKPGDTFEGKYRIERRVGQGGFAQVFLAVQIGLERKVAIKLFDPSSAIESDDISDSAAHGSPSASPEPVDIDAADLGLDAVDSEAASAEADSDSPASPSAPPPMPGPGELPKPEPESKAEDGEASKPDAKSRSLDSLRNSIQSLKRGRDADVDREDPSGADDEPEGGKRPSLGLPKPKKTEKATPDAPPETAPDEPDTGSNADIELGDVSEASPVAESPTGSNSSSQSLKSVVKRFEREAQLVSKLRSPYTVTIHDYGQTKSGVLYMVMEYVDGIGFDQLELPLEPAQVVSVMRQVLMSLREAHNIGVLHRDLKPANMMLYDHAGVEDQVKLLDFGVAKVLRSAKKRREAHEDLTDGDVLIGTPRYMSPEQILGVDLDAGSDVYSFGLVVYELLTGNRAVDLEDEMQILAHHVRPESFTLPDDLEIPVSMRRIVERMLEKDPDTRYGSADAVLTDLQNMNPDTSGITLRSGGIAEISQVIKTHAVDISHELQRSANEMSKIAESEGWLTALKAKEARKPLILAGVFLLVGILSLGLIATSGDDARAGSDDGAQSGDEKAIAQKAEKSAPSEPKTQEDEVEPSETVEQEALEHEGVGAAATDGSDAGDVGSIAENADGGDAGGIWTTILTDPPGAIVFVGEEDLGESPVELDPGAFEYPIDVRAVQDDRETELTLEEPGGEVILELPEPEPDKPSPRPKPKPKKPKFEFKPLE